MANLGNSDEIESKSKSISTGRMMAEIQAVCGAITSSLKKIMETENGENMPKDDICWFWPIRI